MKRLVKNSRKKINIRMASFLPCCLFMLVGATYAPGEMVRISFSASKDTYVTLFRYDVLGNVQLLFPNQNQKNPLVKANRNYYVDFMIERRYVGQTPLELAQINVGEYLVQVELTGYESWQRVVQINDSRTTFLSADLKSTGQYGTIVIRCDVDLARIYLDGQFKRLTHKNRDIVLDDIPAGFHDLSIALSGYHDWSQRIEVKPNQKVQLTIYLDKIVGTGGLEIAGNVDNALIYLDEVYYGETSSSGRITISDIPEGSYELRMVKEGYDDYLTTVRIYPDRISKIDVIMQQEYQEYQKLEEGAVALYCNEDGARIFLDGFYITTTSASQAQVIEELKEGVYEITVIKEELN
ncbi:MAG: PEGA domain protein [Parcubacteria bacterium 32_520]|nr:MAG: PEGA domain protein [Parcubacteria bacterium 32_520]